MGRQIRKPGKCASFDLFFGHPISVNYNGQETYKTTCGACTTLLIFLCLLAFVTLQAKVLFVRFYEVRPIGSGLQDSILSTVTTYDSALSQEGYVLSPDDDFF